MTDISNNSSLGVSDVVGDSELYKCVHCGLCLNVCPTYLETGLEAESPRGRIALMKAEYEGRTSVTDTILSHWGLCLQCRACEEACPSGVPYGRLMEKTWARLMQQGRFSLKAKFLHWLVYRQILPHLGRMYALGHVIRIYQKSGLAWLARKSGILKVLPFGFGPAIAQLPNVPDHFFRPSHRIYPALRQPSRRRVGLLSGCAMAVFHGPVMEAAIRVLTRNGCDVVIPVGQGCCGALNVHGGDRVEARKMARQNIDVFMQIDVEQIVTASAGCGSTMKEYPDLLIDDPDYRDKAERFMLMTMDITEFLISLPVEPPREKLPLRVTYQDPCHLVHAQRISNAPRQVLRCIPGVEIVEMEEANVCCGAAGSYSIRQQKFSNRLLARKMNSISATFASIVVTANPGCMIQLEAGLRARGRKDRVCHVVELLDQAYEAENVCELTREGRFKQNI